MRKDQAVGDNGNGQGAEYRADDRTAPAEQARTAQYNRGNDIELEALPGI